MALADARRHKVRAQNAGTDLIRNQFQILVQGFSQSDYGMFADVVHAHVGCCQQAGHTGCIDDVTFVMRVFFGCFQHHGREQANAMHHTPNIDTQDPLPIGHSVFPNQTARAYTCIVEHKVRHTKMRNNVFGQSFHLLSIGNVNTLGKNLDPQGFDFGFGFVKCVLLHINQDHIHFEPGCNACTLQTKTRTAAS